jgi:DNA recombination protein RmuC
MFIPIEPAYLLAVQHDPDLWSYAYSKRILLISPTNLIACLKLIEDLWKRDMQTKQIKDIVDRGEKMYEKFVGFVETLDKLGKQLNDVQKTYAQSVNQLTTGSGNLIGQAQKLRSLGLKSSKELPPAMVKDDPEEEIND